MQLIWIALGGISVILIFIEPLLGILLFIIALLMLVRGARAKKAREEERRHQEIVNAMKAKE